MLKVKLFTAKGTGDTGFTMPKEFDGKFSQALLDQAACPTVPLVELSLICILRRQRVCPFLSMHIPQFYI